MGSRTDRPVSWVAYEEAVMAGVADVPTPPKDYEMSDAFQEWLLGKMRVEVAQQIAGSGLDRMAVVKATDAADEPNAADEPDAAGEPDEPDADSEEPEQGAES